MAEAEAGSFGYDASDFEWENVHEESPDQVTLDTIGDEFIAEYLGWEDIEFDNNKGEHQEFRQHKFRTPNGPAIINGGYELDECLCKLDTPIMVRIKLIKFVDTGQASKMKSYRIDTGRKPKATPKVAAKA